MAAGLLHEVNNPISYNLAAVHILKRHPGITADEELLEVVMDIEEGLDRVQTIISDLHTFAHPSEVDRQSPFPLSQAVAKSLRFIAHEQKDYAVQVDIDSQDLVMGSESHIIQVFINLLSNAIKAVKAVEKQRLAEISITAKAAKGHQQGLRVTVRDNGVGIASERLPRIFDPFFTSRDVGAGLGLGLSICHSIIKHHGGQLVAESAVDKWTEFSFDLPLV